MKRPTMASRRPLERGEFSWVSMLLLVGTVAAVYLGYVWVPVYMVHLDVKQVVRDYMNQAVHQKSDEALVKGLCAKLANLGSRPGPDGEPTPIVDVSPDDVVWERDTSVQPPMLHVELEYVRTVDYPWLDQVGEVTMSVDLTQDIGVPKWN